MSTAASRLYAAQLPNSRFSMINDMADEGKKPRNTVVNQFGFDLLSGFDPECPPVIRLSLVHVSAFLNRSAFVTTESELALIAALAQIGEIRIPKIGYKTPAATGTLIVLYRNAKNRFWRMLATVARLSRRARAMARKSPLTSVTPALSRATSVPVPIAIPT